MNFNQFADYNEYTHSKERLRRFALFVKKHGFKITEIKRLSKEPFVSDLTAWHRFSIVLACGNKRAVLYNCMKGPTSLITVVRLMSMLGSDGIGLGKYRYGSGWFFHFGDKLSGATTIEFVAETQRKVRAILGNDLYEELIRQMEAVYAQDAEAMKHFAGTGDD